MQVRRQGLLFISCALYCCVIDTCVFLFVKQNRFFFDTAFVYDDASGIVWALLLRFPAATICDLSEITAPRNCVAIV